MSCNTLTGNVPGCNSSGWVTASGTENSITLIPIPSYPPIMACFAGMVLRFIATNTNTGQTTIELAGSGLVPVALLRADGTALTASDLKKGVLYAIVFDGASFRLESVIGSLPGPNPPTPAEGLREGLIGYWPFEGNGRDESGQTAGARPLNLQTGVQFTQGPLGQALDFTRDVNKFASRPVDDSNFDFGDSDFTIQIWASFRGTWEVRTLVEKFKGRSGPGWSISVLESHALEFFANPGVVLTGSPVLDDKWHHYVVRRMSEPDPNTNQPTKICRMFYDGKSVQHAVSLTALSPAQEQPLLVGKRNDPPGVGSFPMDGGLDELAIWNRGLSDKEISDLFNNGNGIRLN